MLIVIGIQFLPSVSLLHQTEGSWKIKCQIPPTNSIRNISRKCGVFGSWYAGIKGHCHGSFAFFRSYLTGNWKLVLILTSNKIPDKPKRKLQINFNKGTTHTKLLAIFRIHRVQTWKIFIFCFFKFQSFSILTILRCRWEKMVSVH